MPPHPFTDIAAIEAAIGEDLGTAEWTEISQSTVDQFADVTGDHQWIHVDVEKAARSAFGGTIAHGYLTTAMPTAFAARAGSQVTVTWTVEADGVERPVCAAESITLVVP